MEDHWGSGMHGGTTQVGGSVAARGCSALERFLREHQLSSSIDVVATENYHVVVADGRVERVSRVDGRGRPNLDEVFVIMQHKSNDYRQTLSKDSQ